MLSDLACLFASQVAFRWFTHEGDLRPPGEQDTFKMLDRAGAKGLGSKLGFLAPQKARKGRV